MVTILLGQVICTDKTISDGGIIVEGTSIRAVDTRKEILANADDFPNGEIVDFGENYLIPGLIDLHFHGSAGADTLDGTSQSIEVLERSVIQGGTTGFLLTTQSWDLDELKEVLNSSSKWINRPNTHGAKVLGFHIEGPFINPKRAGAQPAKYIVPHDTQRLGELITVGNGQVRIVTIAPELPNGLETVEYLRGQGVIASLGHSSADYETTLRAIQNGLSYFTHAFNAMPSLHHRDPGPLGAGLLSESVVFEMIADGIHVHPAVIQLAYRLKGCDGITLVSDSTAMGMAPGVYDQAGRTIVVDDKAIRLLDGTLAGSKLQLNQALKTCVQQAHIPLIDAVRMASTTPARVLGLSDRKGRLGPGYDADIVVLSKDFEVRKVMVAGGFVS